MKQLKRIESILLCVTMLLTLCACGKSEKAERPKLEINGTTQVQESSNAGTSPQADPSGIYMETTDAAEQAEDTFIPVTVCDNEYCTIIQTSPLYNNGQYVDMLVTNKTDGTLTCEFGDQLYINDLRVVGLVYGGGELAAGETKTIRTDLHYTAADQVNKVDCSVSVIYDNKLTGVYAQSFEVFNELVNIYTSGEPVPDKYVSTGNEMAVIDNGTFKIIATQYSVSHMTDDYWMQIYLENNSDDYITFYFIDKVTMTSDMQEEVYELAYKGYSAIASWAQNSYTIEPGMGCYLKVNFDQARINNYAIDINEVITINFPVRVAYVQDEPLYDIDVGRVEADIYTLSFTRDQLVN